MTEQQVQNRIIKEYERNGYYVLKLAKTNKNGIPDVVALKKGVVPVFIEVKRKGEKPSALQVFRINELKKEGFKAFVYDGENIF